MTKRKTPDSPLKGPQPRWFVEVGQRFGAGVVTEPEVSLPGKGRHKNIRGARLLCDCGNEYATAILNLVGAEAQKRGGKSCGCTNFRRRGRDAPRFVDRTGLRYGMLVVLEPQFLTGKPQAYWLCRCDCGNEVSVSGSSLNKGATRSCGCRCRAVRLAPGVAARKRVLKAYTGAAQKRGLCWELADEDFDRLTSQDCFYCGCKPSKVQVAPPGSIGEWVYNGIDRKDNDLGYTLGNVVPCCQICNYSKMDRPFDEFMGWIARLAAYHWFNPELTPSR